MNNSAFSKDLDELLNSLEQVTATTDPKLLQRTSFRSNADLNRGNTSGLTRVSMTERSISTTSLPTHSRNNETTENPNSKLSTWSKATFTGRKKAEKDKMDAIIVENYTNELQWDQDQAILWLKNVLEENYSGNSLASLLADGTVLCRLLKIVVPEKEHSKVIPRYHTGKLTPAQRVENINFFLEGCRRFGLKGTLFDATDVIEDRNMRAVVSCLEQLMKKNGATWQKATNKVVVKMKTEDGTAVNLTVNEQTKVVDLKKKMAEINRIPEGEINRYGIFLLPKRPPPPTPSLSKPSSTTNTLRSQNNTMRSTIDYDEREEEEAEMQGSGSRKNMDDWKSRRRSVFTSGEIAATDEEEPLWIEEGNNATIGDFIGKINENDLSFRKMRKQMSKLLKVTTTEENMKLIHGAASTEWKGAEPPKILPGDEIKMAFKNVAHLHSTKGIVGDLYITKFQLIFVVAQPDSSSQCAKRGFRIPISSIHSVSKCTGVTAKFGKFYCLELKCKDFHELKFSYINAKQYNQTSKSLGDLLESFLFPEDPDLLFAFANNADNAACGKINGWEIYDIKKEFQRIGVNDSRAWRYTELNKKYEYSSSYPNQLVVPSSISDETLKGVFHFRSKGRIPALVWLHPSTAAPLLRCSQPAVGLTGKRCVEDEQLFDAIRNSVPSPDKVYIVDARPHLNAVANQLKGLGYEKAYANMVIQFVGIENIHKMRESAKKLRKVCLSDETLANRLNKVESTKWLGHVRLIFVGADQIINYLQQGQPVLVHCSDGWDRTSQLTSIAQLVLDPYYRTIVGFEVLLEKEWLSFGHKFDQRVGHTDRNVKEQAPIFIQFMDAVWQLFRQYPKAFEFNNYFLRVINMHLISCCFGTFLFNCESERARHGLKKRTLSLWSHINYHAKDFTNPNYSPLEGPLCNSLTDFPLQLWQEYYMYWKQYHDDT